MNTSTASFFPQLAVYTGSSLGSLAQVACGNQTTFHAVGDETYYIQLVNVGGQGGSVGFNLFATPPLQMGFFFSPSDPSTYDTAQFYDSSYDPGGVGITSQSWSFGDGASGTGCCPTHRYVADGDYTVELTDTTADGRVGSTSQVVHVRTHDVMISKFTVPQSASAGQTRQISVSVTNSRYPETVSVQLMASVPGGGFQQVGVLQQQVAARGNTRPTTFAFSYTFTKTDASVGKVTFEAVATIIDARDTQQSDNTAIALATKVK